MERTKYEKLFATPLIRFQVPDAEAFNAELLQEAARLRAQDGGADKSNRGGWHSSGNLFDQGTSVVDRLQEHIGDALVMAMTAIKSRAPLDRLDVKLFGWMNANPKGAFNAPHSHPGAHWSGVHYVTQPEIETGNSGMIEFLDPRSDLPNWRILQAQPFRMKKKIRPQPGEMILFPSYLVHWVYPNEADTERVTIAFNATFKKMRKTGKEAGDAQE